MSGINDLVALSDQAAAIEEALADILGRWSRSPENIESAQRIAYAEASAGHGALADRWLDRRPLIPGAAAILNSADRETTVTGLAHLIERAERAERAVDREEVLDALCSLAAAFYVAIEATTDPLLDRPTARLLRDAQAALPATG